MKFLRRTCKEATALMVAREDRQLPMADRIALWMHLLACQACPRVERQMLTLRNSMRQWRNYVDNTEPNENFSKTNKN